MCDAEGKMFAFLRDLSCGERRRAVSREGNCRNACGDGPCRVPGTAVRRAATGRAAYGDGPVGVRREIGTDTGSGTAAERKRGSHTPSPGHRRSTQHAARPVAARGTAVPRTPLGSSPYAARPFPARRTAVPRTPHGSSPHGHSSHATRLSTLYLLMMLLLLA